MVKLGNDWDILLQNEFTQDYYLKLRRFLIHEYRNQTVYPDMYHIFTALKLTAYEDTKVVVIGQDPYHGPNQAHGLAFSVQPGVKIPPSLMNIFKELFADVNCSIPNNGYLIPWAKQGVLLLNAVLTVRANQAHSHRGKGWEQFTDKIIQLLNTKPTPIVFLLWGNDAKNKAKSITNPNHLILTAAHPSPLSANRGFFGCRHFSTANRFLAANQMMPINWQIPPVNPAE